MVLAPVYLPQGATVTGFTIYYQDNTSTAELNIELVFRWHNSTGVFSPMTIVTSAGVTGNTSGTDNTILSPQKDNQDRVYFIDASSQICLALVPWPGVDLLVRSVVISYTLIEVQ